MNSAQVNETTIAYRDQGAGPATMLIHGAFLSHRDWEPQIEVLSSHFRLIIPDVRAHGESGRDGLPYSVEQFADDMAALLDTLGIDQAVVCGHSLGGMIAQRLALMRAERVRGLILADTSYGTRSMWLEALLTDLTRPLFYMAGIRWQAQFYARAMSRHSPAVRTYVEQEIGAHAANPVNYQAIWDAVIAFDSKAELPRIACPALVLVGERNTQTHPQGRNMARLIPDARLVTVPGAGHMLNWDNPAFFNNTLLSFLRERVT